MSRLSGGHLHKRHGRAIQDRGVGSWIERRARITPDQPALIHGEWRHTYSELANRVRRLAHGFSELGVQREIVSAGLAPIIRRSWRFVRDREAWCRHGTGQSSARRRRHHRCAMGYSRHGRRGGAGGGWGIASSGVRGVSSSARAREIDYEHLVAASRRSGQPGHRTRRCVHAPAHLWYHGDTERGDADARQHHLERRQLALGRRFPQRRRDHRYHAVLPDWWHRRERAAGPVHGRDGHHPRGA